MTNGALSLLHSMVSTAAWASTPKQVMAGGNLSEKIESVMGSVPENADIRKIWEREDHPLFVLEGQDFQAALDATKFFISKSAIPPTRSAVEILTAVKLTE